MTKSVEQLSEESQPDRGREELIARITGIRGRGADATEDFRLAGMELEATREEQALAEADHGDWDAQFQNARDAALRNRGRLDVTIEQLGKLAGE